MAFVLKPTLSEVNVTKTCFLVFSIHMIYHFPFPYFQFIWVFALSCVSWRQHIVGFLFFNPVCHCLLIGAFSPLTFKVIIEKYVFIVFYNSCPS